MQTAKINDQSYQGKTRNPNGRALAHLIKRYSRIRSPEQCRKLLTLWGLAPKQNHNGNS